MEAPAAGQVLQGGAYTIVRSLAKGGMGAIFLAHDHRAFDRLSVIKQMLDDASIPDPEERRLAQARFEEEGRILASLSHPGIPRIYAFFREGGRHFMVLEYVQGEDLEVFITRSGANGRVAPRRRLHVEEVLRYGVQGARVLEYLHAQSSPVVHQDVKPSNLIVDAQSGEVRLLDFGAASTASASPSPNPEPAGSYGTDGYAPPEQYRGKPVPRSDVYALAATLYHLLTDDDPRAHPFQWPAMGALGREIAVMLGRALRADPDDRPSARELRQTLESFVTPSRTLEVFTFPGGAQIRTVAALASLCDQHWQASRGFLYRGDLQRWLRDINRLDLASEAERIVKQETNQDLALEQFLHAADPGLAYPRLAASPTAIDLGAIARHSDIARRVTISNTARGYAVCEVRAGAPWLEVYPEHIHVWPEVPAEIAVHIRGRQLPLRPRQRAEITIRPATGEAVSIPVAARVSAAREVLRLIWCGLHGAIPEAWRCGRRAWLVDARLTVAFARPFRQRPWVFWLVWAGLAVTLGTTLTLKASWAAHLPAMGRYLSPPIPMGRVVAVALVGPLLIPFGLWLIALGFSVVASALWGALRGAWQALTCQPPGRWSPGPRPSPCGPSGRISRM